MLQTVTSRDVTSWLQLSSCDVQNRSVAAFGVGIEVKNYKKHNKDAARPVTEQSAWHDLSNPDVADSSDSGSAESLRRY
jgi:hypothetical protein